MNNSPKVFYAAVGLIVVGAAYAPKNYPVIHTEAEWAAHLQGLGQIQQVIHQSNLPANTAFWCDSVLTAQQNDIFRQVMAAKAADTTKKAIKP